MANAQQDPNLITREAPSEAPAAGPGAVGKPSETKDGHNEIVCETVHYGPWPMIFEKGVEVKARDGTILFVNVFRPKKPGRFPVVMSADVYGKDSSHMVQSRTMPKPGPNTLGQFACSEWAAWEAPDPGYWVPNDYVLVKCAFRGTDGSKGRISPMSLLEAGDYYDMIEWAAAQPWSNGKIGLNGVSYLAKTQWRVAQLHPPHLAAIVPWEGNSDYYRDWSFHGGIPETSFAPGWDAGIRRRWSPDDFDSLVNAADNHPFLDQYWMEKVGDLSDITVRILACASWSTHGLHCRGTIEGFRQASSSEKWIYMHGRKEWETYYGREALERQRRFFDHYLKGLDNDWELTPRVIYERREHFYDGTFRTAEDWPVPGTDYVPLYLDASSGTMGKQAAARESSVSYDPAVTGGGGQAAFRFRFDADTELSGFTKLRLWVETKGADDMDLFIGLKKYDRRGNEVHFPDFNHIENGRVSRGWLRVSHRELDPQRSTPYQPWPKHERALKLKPGEIVPVDIEVLSSSTLFRAGEYLEVTVQGQELANSKSNPLPIVHGRISNAHNQLANGSGKHVIHTGGIYDSHLLVPVVPLD